jgi:TolB-like protein
MTVPVLVLVAAAVFGQAKPRLGILSFTGGSVRDGDTMANLFANSPDLRREFTTTVRTGSSLASIMQEQRFQRSGITDSDTISDLGKLMNAQYVVSGHTASLGSMNLLLISIVDVKTMRQIAGDYRSYRRIEDVDGLIPSMAANIIAATQGENSSGNTLAVLPLNIEDSQVQQGDAEILAQILATEIANGHKYAVFPRTRALDTVIQEHNIQSSNLTDPNNVIEIRKATNARYVLAGTVTRLGSKNMFLVQILDIETGELIEGASRTYADLAEGRDLMAEIVFEITGVEAGQFAEARQRERQEAAEQLAEEQRQRDEEAARREAERKRLARENFKRGLNDFFLDGNRFTSISANLGLGFGNRGEDNKDEHGYGSSESNGLRFNLFGNISVTIPLVWTLFAEAGIDIGFTGAIGDIDNGSDRYGYEDDSNNGKYSAIRPYGRLNIGIPLGDRDFLILPYAGVGYGYMSASYEYTAMIPGHYGYTYDEYGQPNNYVWVPDSEETQTKTLKYGGMDLVLGAYATWGHHGGRLAVNFNNISAGKYFEVQTILGYVFRF